MNLHALLGRRAAEGKPVRIGLIGAGKFGTMFLAQAALTPGFHVVAIADLAPEKARSSLANAGWPEERFTAPDMDTAMALGRTWITEDAEALLRSDVIEVMIDATGHPAAGIRHARLARENGKHMVMVNVEADALAGPLLAAEAAKAGLVYSLAYGDQPALICEMVDWARTCGFPVVAAGKGTKYLPSYHKLTPDDVWQHYGITAEAAAEGGMNPQMFNSFMDGTKSAIEMAAVANATGLSPAPGGLEFPPVDAESLASVLRPASEGGCLHHKGQVEVISSLARDGSTIERDLRWGVYVVFEAPSDYARRCFGEYGLATDPSGRYAAMYKPYHLIGLELGISVAYAGLLGQATGAACGWSGDVVATAKRDLQAGETLDGEGGYTVWGKLMPAAESLRAACLPLGLAQGVKLARPVAEDAALSWDDVAIDSADATVACRREMEQHFASRKAAAAE
ncbi:flagellar biosynthesis protein FlgA [Pelagibius litoralis]|uniref:Flagellar biosynthesis protein FlgA n=1 Tax=Pelagibius litoralis TaxID=374515 RepID=A0A967EWT4_9PROT|nr:SAF domain-containing protein [Pelagibius litoralis]NIA68253.1 flagellar biosynthesis protein FlgA [Pelagibius litoralis]